MTQATPQSIANDVRATADSAVQISQKVIISSILPRADNSSAQLKAENVNINIKRMCDLDGKLSFCDNDCNFRLADKSIDELVLWKDKHHLRYVGTDRLINNLKIDARVRKRTPAFNRPQPPRNWQTSQPSRNWSQNNSAVPPLLSFPPPFRQFPWKNQSTCQTCFRNDHNTYSCPKTANIFCFKCGCRGHTQNNCSS